MANHTEPQTLYLFGWTSQAYSWGIFILQI